eukprot:gene22564-biopygen13286
MRIPGGNLAKQAPHTINEGAMVICNSHSYMYHRLYRSYDCAESACACVGGGIRGPRLAGGRRLFTRLVRVSRDRQARGRVERQMRRRVGGQAGGGEETGDGSQKSDWDGVSEALSHPAPEQPYVPAPGIRQTGGVPGGRGPQTAAGAVLPLHPAMLPQKPASDFGQMHTRHEWLHYYRSASPKGIILLGIRSTQRAKTKLGIRLRPTATNTLIVAKVANKSVQPLCFGPGCS